MNNIINLQVEKRILENQEVIMLALENILQNTQILVDKSLLSDESVYARSIGNKLIDCYHETRRILNKKYIDRYKGNI